MKGYTSEKDILNLLEQFESGTVPREDWGHPEHLIVALCYVTANDAETALAKMRSGIFNLLRSFKIDLSKEMPYHETLTVFWIRTIAEFAERTGGKSLVEKASELVAAYDKNYPLNFYSRELLFSEEARANFVDGDLKEAARK
jgi:hypothetical protein